MAEEYPVPTQLLGRESATDPAVPAEPAVPVVLPEEAAACALLEECALLGPAWEPPGARARHQYDTTS